MFFGGKQSGLVVDPALVAGRGRGRRRADRRDARFATGTDPLNPALTYKVFARDYENGLVLYKPLSYKSGIGEGTRNEQTATTHQLGGSYRRVNADGTLGPVITSIRSATGKGRCSSGPATGSGGGSAAEVERRRLARRPYTQRFALAAFISSSITRRRRTSRGASAAPNGRRRASNPLATSALSALADQLVEVEARSARGSAPGRSRRPGGVACRSSRTPGRAGRVARSGTSATRPPAPSGCRSFVSRMFNSRTPPTYRAAPTPKPIVRLVRPVPLVVPAPEPGAGEVRDLVVLEPRRREPVDGVLVHRQFVVLRHGPRPRRRAAASRAACPSRRSGRRWRGGRERMPSARSTSALHDRASTRRGEDQVERQRQRVPPHRLDGPRDLLGRVPAVERGERLRPERLHADADARHAVRGEHGGLLVVEAVGRGFDGELSCRAACGSHRLMLVQQPPELIGIQVRRRAAADEQRLDRPRLAERRQFERERVEVQLDEVVVAGGDGEVAVAAVVGAERDVDVGGSRFEPGRQSSSHHVARSSGRRVTRLEAC